LEKIWYPRARSNGQIRFYKVSVMLTVSKPLAFSTTFPVILVSEFMGILISQKFSTGLKLTFP